MKEQKDKYGIVIPAKVIAINKQKNKMVIIWSIGIILSLIWFSLLVTALIPVGETFNYNLDANGNVIEYSSTQMVEAMKIGQIFHWEPKTNTFKRIISSRDMNIFYEYIGKDPLALMFLVFTPLGYLGIIFLIALRTNIVTPETIKSGIQKAISFGYLTKHDLEEISQKIDISTGWADYLKKRKSKEVDDE